MKKKKKNKAQEEIVKLGESAYEGFQAGIATIRTEAAVIRIHGEASMERIKAATETFLKKVEKARGEKNH